MDFEHIKVIWDSQNAQPLYAINETEMHTVVQRRNREFRREEACRYWREISAGALFGALIMAIAALLALGTPRVLSGIDWIRVPVSTWDVAALLTAGAIFLYYAAYMFGVQRRQQRREQDFADTLRGDIDRALARTAFLTRIARGLLWRCLVPQWVAALLWVVTLFRLLDADLLHYLGMFAVMAAGLWICVRCEQRRIVNRFEPRRRELDALRRKLSDPQC